MKNNIDKDIEIIKTKIEYYKNNPEGCNWRLSFEDTEDIQAIENVLSEFLGLREFSAETVRNNAELKQEQETYKKIAEKLADILSHKILETLGIKPRIEDLIESARNEVEKK